jgi:hypothetical protein
MRWRGFEHDESGCSTRYQMTADLLERHRLVGMRRTEVESLLGPAESEHWNELYPHPGWGLGRRPRSTDGTALIVEFDAGGRAVRVFDPGH